MLKNVEGGVWGLHPHHIYIDRTICDSFKQYLVRRACTVSCFPLKLHAVWMLFAFRYWHIMVTTSSTSSGRSKNTRFMSFRRACCRKRATNVLLKSH